MTPIIDGYDEYEPAGGGFKNFAPGNHTATIVKAEFETAEKDFEPNDALIISLSGEGGESARVWIRIPRSSEQWQSWNPKPGKKAGLRDVVKQQLLGLGMPMSSVESDEARGALIGREVPIEVKQNGAYTNINFRETQPSGSVSLPEPERVAEGTPAPVSPVAVVV